MKMNRHFQQCLIRERDCLLLTYLVSEEIPGEFSIEVVLKKQDDSEEKASIHNLSLPEDSVIRLAKMLADHLVTPTTFWDVLEDFGRIPAFEKPSEK